MKKKTLLSLLVSTAIALSASISIPMSIHGGEREKIHKVTLTINSEISPDNYDGNVDIEVGTDANYSVDTYEIIHLHNDERTRYDSPRIKITVTANEGYYFKGKGKSFFGLKGKDVYRYVDSSRYDDNSRIDVTVDLKPTGGQLANPTDIRWTANGQATWTKPYNAQSYEVQLYRGDRRIKNDSTKTTTYDFSQDIESDEYEYYFKVRSITTLDDSSVLRSNWKSSPIYDMAEYGVPSKKESETTAYVDLSQSAPLNNQGQWLQSENNWWYQNSDGTRPVSAWHQIDSRWYYFDSSGYMLTGWQNIGGQWYYLGDDGAMYSNTRTPDGYQVGADGALY